MIYSMTGYGAASREQGDKTYRIEIKSLNGKNAEIRFKSNSNLRDKEITLRKMITDMGHRGKFEVNITMTSQGENASQLNKFVMQKYYDDLKAFSDQNGLPSGDILQTVIRLPNVVQLGDDQMDDEEWNTISAMTEEAMGNLNKFREQEGATLEKDLITNVHGIQEMLKQVPAFEEERIETIKVRIKKNLQQHLSGENADKNRFEQELLYYLEKLDINEEKVRLDQHCNYFLEELPKPAIKKGKKLNFISQEMGREINTLGAKAQHGQVQQRVVMMKDHLEKIKEQILNIL